MPSAPYRVKHEAWLLHSPVRFFTWAAVEACPGPVASTLTPMCAFQADPCTDGELARSPARLCSQYSNYWANWCSLGLLFWTVLHGVCIELLNKNTQETNKALSLPEPQFIFGKCDGCSDLSFPENKCRTLCSLTVVEWTVEVTRSALHLPCCAFGPYIGEVGGWERGGRGAGICVPWHSYESAGLSLCLLCAVVAICNRADKSLVLASCLNHLGLEVGWSSAWWLNNQKNLNVILFGECFMNRLESLSTKNRVLLVDPFGFLLFPESLGRLAKPLVFMIQPCKWTFSFSLTRTCTCMCEQCYHLVGAKLTQNYSQVPITKPQETILSKNGPYLNVRKFTYSTFFQRITRIWLMELVAELHCTHYVGFIHNSTWYEPGNSNTLMSPHHSPHAKIN